VISLIDCEIEGDSEPEFRAIYNKLPNNINNVYSYQASGYVDALSIDSTILHFPGLDLLEVRTGFSVIFEFYRGVTDDISTVKFIACYRYSGDDWFIRLLDEQSHDTVVLSTPVLAWTVETNTLAVTFTVQLANNNAVASVLIKSNAYFEMVEVLGIPCS
jgi:hypothetical protein